MDDPGPRRSDQKQPSQTQQAFRQFGTPRVPAHTPPEIADRIRFEPAEPYDAQVEKDPPPVVSAESLPPAGTHRLVVLGDSLSQGFKSFAIHETHLSWPAMVANYGGIAPFRHPHFAGPNASPGLPLNLESTIKGLDWPDSLLEGWDSARMLVKLQRLMDDVEDYWEDGPGDESMRQAPASGEREIGRVNHNLASWGQDIRDALSLDVRRLQRRVYEAPRRGDDPLNQFPSAAYERSALITLQGGEESDTAVSLARALGEDGGIETLVVGLGANNILGTVIDFKVHWTQDADYDDVDRTPEHKYNAWTPEHFRHEFDALLDEVKQIKARNVIVLTVPHVTIAPMVRGVGTKMPGDRYFARYTRPWISDQVFNPNRHDCLTGDQLRVLDCAVDLYNEHICAEVERADGHNGQQWRILDTASILDRLAYRRYLIDDEAKPPWWTPYDLPREYRQLSPLPDTRFLKSDRFGRTEGGLFSLDGIHPTTIGYAIVAREVMRLMAKMGVSLVDPEPDFAEVLDRDTIIKFPPVHLASVLPAVAFGNRVANLLDAIKARPEIM